MSNCRQQTRGGTPAWGKKKKVCYKILHRASELDDPKEKEHSEDVGIGAKILEWILGKEYGKVWTELIWLRTGTSGR
jgi:hypothetical protein